MISYYKLSLNLDEVLSRKLNIELRLEDVKGKDKNTNFDQKGNQNTNAIAQYVVDWSDDGEGEDDTPRNDDLLSRLAEESEDECDQDVLQFSR